MDDVYLDSRDEIPVPEDKQAAVLACLAGFEKSPLAVHAIGGGVEHLVGIREDEHEVTVFAVRLTYHDGHEGIMAVDTPATINAILRAML